MASDPYRAIDVGGLRHFRCVDFARSGTVPLDGTHHADTSGSVEVIQQGRSSRHSICIEIRMRRKCSWKVVLSFLSVLARNGVMVKLVSRASGPPELAPGQDG